ncbi:MAG TPA: LapA family protein [Usitatibacteraceae bacterium]|nr:LapA family protein [Usitatibacteraceae bacterium]
MRKSKLIGWLLILGFLAVVIYQNEDHFLNTAQSLRLNVKAFPEYVSPVLPLAVFHLLFFVFGLAVAFAFSSLNRFRLRRAFKRLNATVDAQQSEIQALKTELARVTGAPLPLPGGGAAAPPPGRP